MKTPKFLFCENPIASRSSGRQFILHTRQPMILAECFHCGTDGDYPEEAAMDLKRRFNVWGTLDYTPLEYVVIGAVWIEPIESSGNAQQDANHLAGIMRRMADWYEAYLKWEDEQPREGVDDDD